MCDQVGIYVTVQEVLSGVMKKVCVAFSTFVAKPRGTRKVRQTAISNNNPVRSAKRLCLMLQVTLRPLDLHGSAEEMFEHSLASERRRLRLYNEEAFKNLMSDYYNLQDKGECLEIWDLDL